MSAVWISYAMIDPENKISPLANDLEDSAAIEALNRNDAGEPLPAAMFPKMIWAAEPGLQLRALPPLFWANGFWVINGECGDVLRSCNLGSGALYPVDLLQNDRSTKVPGDFHCLNFGNVKPTFLPEKSARADQNPFNPAVWYPETNLRDGDIAVSRAALDGPDLWLSPPLKRAFFVSDRLAAALKSAGVDKPFGLRACVIS